MNQDQNSNNAGPRRPWPLLVMVGLALVANGLAWAVHFPPLHPNDEPQHYLYALRYTGTPGDDGGQPRAAGQVPRDLRALAELVEYGPHRLESRPIDLSADRVKRLQPQTDDPALAKAYAEEDRVYKMVAHEGFERYHPPTYYFVTGQALRLGQSLGMGLRGRLLLGRLLSLVLGLLAVGLVIALAREVWPGRWGLPVLVGLVTGWQSAIAFYTSVLNNDALTLPLCTAFLLLGAKLIRGRWGIGRAGAMGGLCLAAIATKVTMFSLVPVGLAGVVLSRAPRWARAAAAGLLVLMVAGVLAWLLIPLGGGGSMTAQYLDQGVQSRSFPAEMFTVERVRNHLKFIGHLWGRGLGNALETDARMPAPVFFGFMALTVLAYGLGLVRLRRADADRRRVLLWLLLPPVMLFSLLYVIDYRFASIGGGRFFSRPQYFVPCAAAVMVWTVWGLLGGLRGRALAAAAGVLAGGAGLHNLIFLFGLIGPRYCADIGWWGQCRQAAVLWPIPAWAVAAIDVGAVLTGLAAVIALVRRVQRESGPSSGDSMAVKP